MLLPKRIANLPDFDIHLRKIVFFLILSVGTILTYDRVDKYIENPEQILTNPAFTDGLQGWQVDVPATASVTANPGFVRLQANEARSSVRLSQSLDPLKIGKRVVLRGKIKAVGIQGGKQGWEKGRIVLFQYIDGKAIYSTPHLLAALDGTHDWEEYSVVIPVLSGVSEALVVIQLNHCIGELQFSGLSLFQVEDNPGYQRARWMVFAGWAIFLGCVFAPGLLGPYTGRLRPALILLVCLAILLGTTVPGGIKNDAKYELLNQAHSYASQVVELGGPSAHTLAQELKKEKWLKIDITKVAHFLLFAVLGGLLYVRQDQCAVWSIFVDSGILACSTEFLQLFVDDRSALVGDVLIDLAGVGCAVLLLRVVFGRAEAQKGNRPKKVPREDCRLHG